MTLPIRAGLLAAALLLAPAATHAQPVLTTPEQHFGHVIGADYVLPDYEQFARYWEKLAGESPRMVLDTIGTTVEGRPQLMAIVTSPQNQARLARYREIARRLALAENVDSAAAAQLAREGRAVVWIDGGLHATETLGAQQLLETVWQLVSRDDAETRRILDDVIVLAVHANPDGMQLVSEWYMRFPELHARTTRGLPRLYHKYIGHDNNRDFYASTQPETENMNRVLYREWFPQLLYNHHQTAPAGTVMFAPPFRDPFNYHLDPLIPVGIDLVGAAMHTRFLAEGRAGVTMRGGASYSTWWNGGLRTTAYFHNMIGLLTETIGDPTPLEIPFVVDRQLPGGSLPAPIAPQTWRFRQSVDYSVTANYAVLDLASRYREQFLLNVWRMGRNAIERGSGDHWTPSPRRIAAARAALAAELAAAGEGEGEPLPPARELRGSAADHARLLRDPALRDARGYIIPADQPDFLTAAKFVDALLETGVAVHRATRAFEVAGRRFPAGSFVVKTAQAFRPHVLDMFEPQDHPDDIPFPGGPPTPPYDNAGWTLAFQMGVEFVRVPDGFDGPFERIEGVRAPRPAGSVTGSARAGWLLDARANDAVHAGNRLLAAGAQVFRLAHGVRLGGRDRPAGTFFIRAGGGVAGHVRALADELGLTFEGVDGTPRGRHHRLALPRIALWDRYGGSMPSGWTRWLLEQFAFPHELVFARGLDAGGLRERFDAIILVDGAFATGTAARAPTFDTLSLSPELRARLGSLSEEHTIPALRTFLERGGTVITIGSATRIGELLGLPLASAPADSTGQPLPASRYYVPGSILQARVDTLHPAAWGLPERLDLFFDRSPAFRLAPGAGERGLRALAWFDSPAPLRSGWALGQHHLEGAIAAASAAVGEGTLYLFGPEIAFRAQPHGSFKLLFNALQLSAASPGPGR